MSGGLHRLCIEFLVFEPECQQFEQRVECQLQQWQRQQQQPQQQQSGAAGAFRIVMTARFPDLRTIDQAWRQCRRRKRRTPQAQIYEVHLLDNLVGTAQALQEERWRPARPVCFTVFRPKAREIHAAAYRDRVVHHWLVPRLETIYEPVFIHDVYSNRQGKGTHAAVRRLQAFMHAQQSISRKNGWFLQLDIANFFMSLDRALLFSLLQRRLRKAVRQGKLPIEEARKLRWLCHRILKQEVGREAWCAANAHEVARVPVHKRLRNTPPNKGLPIGNLTSQFFANVYLNELDQFIKHRLKCRYYLRYVDDMVLLADSRKQLVCWQEKISAFLQQELALQLRADSLLAPVGQGADFLGYIIRPHYCLVRRRVVDNLTQKLAAFERQQVPPLRLDRNGQTWVLERASLEKLRALLASYLGHFRHANSYRLITSLWRKWPWLPLLFTCPTHARLLPRWLPVAASVTGYGSQVGFFRRQFPHARVVVQRGCETDIFAPWMDRHRSLPKMACPLSGIRQVNVVESGYLKGGLKRRLIHSFQFEPGVQLCRNP